MKLKYFIEKSTRFRISDGPLYAFDGKKWYVFDFSEKMDFKDYHEPTFDLIEINPYDYLASERYLRYYNALKNHLIKDLFDLPLTDP